MTVYSKRLLYGSTNAASLALQTVPQGKTWVIKTIQYVATASGATVSLSVALTAAPLFRVTTAAGTLVGLVNCTQVVEELEQVTLGLVGGGSAYVYASGYELDKLVVSPSSG